MAKGMELVNSYLDDLTFLQALDKLNLRTHYVKIILLTFDEKPIKEIQGIVTSGNLSVNGSSAVRRTINLTLKANPENSNIEDIDNEISINKKVRVSIGLKNPLKSYSHYGDIIWFPQGVFILSSASISRSTSGWNISISGRDKMCLLDGTVGGTIPASTTFHEREIHLENGDVEIEQPTIRQIIYEAVNHWGGEQPQNIVISDLEDEVKFLMRYMGDSPVWFTQDYSSLTFDQPDADKKDNYIQVEHGKDIGYKETEFTYPGELVLNAGETVVSLLDKIKNTLNNYEYFYTVEGKFVFQQIKNYLNTASDLRELEPNNYVKNYNNAKFLYSLTDLDTTVSINNSPKYENIKNDFYVWGNRKTSSGIDVAIRYHLAIDAKPTIDLAGKYMWVIKDETTNSIIRYDFKELYTDKVFVGENEIKELVAPPCGEWREELYRRALDAQVNGGVYNNYYDSELLAEWRNLYDPNRKEWARYENWNPDVTLHPENINFWLDFIDVGSEMGKYSINQIGRRTKVVNNNNIKSVYNSEVPDIIFLNGINQEAMQHYTSIGQNYFVLTDQVYDLFSASTTGVSCFDQIREMIYQNLCYNTSISISCLPKYYMEPNNIIYIEDRDSGIKGNYQITQFTVPLTYNGTMNITATEVLTRV